MGLAITSFLYFMSRRFTINCAYMAMALVVFFIT